MNWIKVTISLILLLVIICLCGCAPQQSCKSGSVYFYVDGSKGYDANPGTKRKPFQTIQKAQQAVREQIASGMRCDVTVLIRGGEYFFEDSLHFGVQDSGRDGFNVNYKGYGEEQVELIGGRAITGWKVHQDGIYKASVGSDYVFRNMMENGELAVTARIPNEGYFGAGEGTASLTDDTPSRLVMNPEDVQMQFGADDLEVLIWSGQHKEWDNAKNFNWYTTIMYATAIDWDTRTIDLKDWAHFYMHPRNRYYLRNKLEFLDRPGEFYLDSGEGVLYYKPRNLPIEQQEIVAATTFRLIEIYGDAIEKPAGNLVFENLHFVLSDAKKEPATEEKEDNCDGMFFLRNAENVTVRNCRLKNAGMSSIAMQGANEGHLIYGNLIEDMLHNGVCMWGYSLPDPDIADETQGYVNKNHVIENNYIRRFGKLVGHSAGVEMLQAGDILVSHNLIEDGPRYGVAAYYSIYSVMANPHGKNKGVIYGKKITWDNHYDFNFTRNIRVHNNEIRRVMQDSSDGGAVNFYGVGLGNRIENNFVHDVRTAIGDGMVMGLYVDDHSNGMVVQNNIVCRLDGSKYVVPLMIKGINNIVSNNILANNKSMNWGMTHVLETPIDDFTQWVPEDMGPEKTDNLSFERNIFYYNSGETVYSVFPLNETIVAKSDYNLIYPKKEYKVMLEWKMFPFSHWLGLFDGRYDSNTIFADPMFVDPDHMDYRLHPDSPAYKLGFEDIDMSTMGLKGDFPFAVE